MTKTLIAHFDARTNNGISGTVRFVQRTPQTPTQVIFELAGFQPYAVHAIHIHELGDLTEGCKSLGPHYNPYVVAHGHGLQGHAGDLFNNLQADAQGRFVVTFTSPLLSCGDGPASIVGRSVVIHQFQDDLGFGGQITADGVLHKYADFTTDQLRELSRQLGYALGFGSRASMLQRLEKESVTTGNAATRIACAIIGRAK